MRTITICLVVLAAFSAAAKAASAFTLAVEDGFYVPDGVDCKSPAMAQIVTVSREGVWGNHEGCRTQPGAGADEWISTCKSTTESAETASEYAYSIKLRATDRRHFLLNGKPLKYCGKHPFED